MTTFDGQLLASVLVLAAFGAGAVLRGLVALRAFGRASAGRTVMASATPAPRPGFHGELPEPGGAA